MPEAMASSRRSEDAAHAFALCAALVEEHTQATGAGAYADGFRAAATRIVRQIALLRAGQPSTRLERDLRDAEVEARTLARVVLAAERVSASMRASGGSLEGAAALGALLEVFFAPDELPASLRPTPTSEVRLTRPRVSVTEREGRR
jgi:hypothetical protein